MIKIFTNLHFLLISVYVKGKPPCPRCSILRLLFKSIQYHLVITVNFDLWIPL